MSSTVFTPLTQGFSWTDSAGVDANGNPLPEGEAPVSSTLGIRADGDSAFSPGNYKYQVTVAYPTQTESVSDLTTALASALPPGNYWAAVKQTDKLGDASVDSPWTTEVPFSIPMQAVEPASPTALAVS